MAEDVEIPKVGKLPKKVIVPLAVGLVAFVGWRFWQARSAGNEDTTITDGEFGAVDSSIPGVIGAVSPTNEYGSDTGNSSDGGTDSPGRFTTNAGWSAYVRSQLQGSYDDSTIVGALGNYLGSQPLSTEQQTIVRAAIAVGGYPPVGTFSIISGGNTPITVAPTGLRVTATTDTTVSLAWSPVPGAAGYRVYRSGAATNVGSSVAPDIRIDGLQPGTTYSFRVRAMTASAQGGPESGAVSATTKTVSLGRPSTPTVSSIAKTSVRASTTTVSGADGYRWYIDGVARGYSESPSYTINALSPGRKYTVTVAADRARQNPGPVSAGRSFTTKK
jgi:hypothetical protein